MRKLRVALVILLLLTIVAVSYAASASLAAKSIGDSLSVGKSRAALNQIQQKLATGNSDIAKQSAELDAYAKYMAAKNMRNVSQDVAIKPPSTRGLGVPMSGIGDAIKALGSINVNIESPAAMAKSIKMPVLAVM